MPHLKSHIQYESENLTKGVKENIHLCIAPRLDKGSREVSCLYHWSLTELIQTESLNKVIHVKLASQLNPEKRFQQERGMK